MCRLSGPTKFGDILKYAKDSAKNQVEEYSYTILLIITDGVIDDMTLSSDLIVESSTLPLSIVIVGVGGADFSNMHKLDADEIPLVHSRTGIKMKNDIVQFVPMREVKAKSQYFNLAKEVLEEVPGQVTTYMRCNNVEPRTSIARVFKTPYGEPEAPAYPVPGPYSSVPAVQQGYGTPYPPGPQGYPQGYGYGAPPPPAQGGGYPPHYVTPSAPPSN
ncbi:Copine-8 [Oopsacas minuta]|uniref:Copine-8 n=1 Tax=Oopsacas minuta TaxID=111878 RepID=A0AAV7KA99_9METZ|nr:Copine-8 [Oopsacas minuta]